MVHPRIFGDLLQEPLGPYRDRDILHEAACQMKGVSELVLYSFILEHDGRVIGLDESERPLEGSDNRKFRFRGVLKIADPGWLSDFGLKVVEAELNLRAKEYTLRQGGRGTPQLTLEDLFGSGLLTKSHDAHWQKEERARLMVQIQGEKNMPATYMQSSQVPDGLLWSSKAHNRNYKIATMDVETYSRSENFFWRWRLFALMEKIAKRFLYVPPKKRTPGWFAEKYIMGFACPPRDKHQRLIFDEEDEDVDETGKTVTPRHLLKPHTSDILGLFAAHADWFITHNEVRRKKLLDIISWEKFAREARRQKKEAARQGVKWGWAPGEEVEEESSEEDEGNTDGLDRLVRENPVIGKSNKTLVRKLQRAQARPDRETGPSFSSDSESEGNAPGGAEYVSDFSESSDTEEIESDHQLAEEEVANQIPWQLQLPPLLPDVDGRWYCPLRECNYQISLYDLTEEERRGVPMDLIDYILQRQWRNAADDKKVLQGFKLMVTNHYLKHFEERGIKVEKREGRTRFVSINGRQRRRGGEEPVRGPMPVRGTLGGESRIVPTVHAPQIEH